MKKKEETEFISAVYDALVKEQGLLRKITTVGLHDPACITDGHFENAFVYTIFKHLCNSDFFEKWSIDLEDWYPKKKHVKPLQADIVMARRTNKNDANYSPWNYIEFGYYKKSKICRDLDKLRWLWNHRLPLRNLEGTYIISFGIDNSKPLDRIISMELNLNRRQYLCWINHNDKTRIIKTNGGNAFEIAFLKVKPRKSK